MKLDNISDAVLSEYFRNNPLPPITTVDITTALGNRGYLEFSTKPLSMYLYIGDKKIDLLKKKNRWL